MNSKTFASLISWEIDEYLNLPVFCFLVASAVVATLFQGAGFNPLGRWATLYDNSGQVFFVLALVVGALFSRSYAGNIGRGETKVLFSYPIQRWQMFLSKFVALFAVVFVVYSVSYSVNIYLLGLSLFEPMFFLVLLGFLLQLMLACGVAVAFSMVTKNEIISVLASILLLFSLDNITDSISYFSAQGRLAIFFQYFGGQLYGKSVLGANVIVSFDDVLAAVLVPLLIFVFLFVLAFVYFTRFMEVD
jgi:ABC-type transport system involved in multi-copper enzyme maturation permease subunit